MSAGVSDEEIAREFRTLRTLRRRSGSSTGPGALPLDPDLPPPSPSSASSVPSYSSNDDITLATPDGLDGGFWVPAHLHPELAPGEFRAFLKAHTHADPEHADPEEAGEAAGLKRSPSWLARNGSRRESGLGRKRSMLSRQYQPRLGDHDEEEVPPLPDRQRGSIYGGRTGEKGLTLHDLQKLEELVDEAGEDDPEQMRSMLRRSLSLNVAPGFLQDDQPQGEADRPARPGSILRRSVRTKIRKAGLPGDGGGHRFAATRKGRMTAAPVINIPGLEDDDDPSGYRRAASPGVQTGSDESEDVIRDDSLSSQENEDDETSSEQQHRPYIKHIENLSRRGSDASTETDETQIFDAYARDSRGSSISGESSSFSGSPSPEGSPPNLKLDLPPLPRSPSDWFREKDMDKTPTQDTSSDPLKEYRRPSPSEEFEGRQPASHLPGLPILRVPTDQPQASSSSRSPTSPTTPKASFQALPPGMAPPATRTSIHSGIPTQQPQPQPQQSQPQAVKENPVPPPLTRTESRSSTVSSVGPTREKEKEKKGGFFSKSKDKEKDKDKKGKKDKDRFLGSLFGSKKKHEEPPSSVSNFATAGPAAAAALLGTSKSAKSHGTAASPTPNSPNFQNNSYARYPIHVERAVYRLSHIKLANARRPLYEQVLISNLMFWYLGVIGRNVAEEKKANGSAASGGEDDKRNDKAPVVKGTPPKPVDSGSAGKPLPREAPEHVPIRETRERERDVAPSGKKTGLTKPDRSRQPGRDAEAPVRSPSYGMQNAQVDSEMRNAGIGLKGPRPPSTGGGAYPPPQQHHLPPPQQHIQQPQHLSPQQQHQSREPPYSHPQQSAQRAGPLPQPMGNHSAVSPPQPGPARSPIEHPMGAASGPSGPRDPRDIRAASTSPPYGLPNGHAPPGQPQMGPGQPMHDPRDVRQRTYSNPAPPPMQSRESAYPPHIQTGAPPAQLPQRRAVSEVQRGGPGYESHREGPISPVRTGPSPSPAHSGPQPGQIFHHPSSPAYRPPSPGLQPGQIRPYPPQQAVPPPMSYGGQPGQIFRPPPGTVRPMPLQGWEPPQRLPPGASPAPGQPHPRSPQGYGGPYSNGPYPARPPHPQHPPNGPPLQGGPYYASGPPPGPRPPNGQIPAFSPYAVPPPPQPGREGEYRRPQPVPGNAFHHR